MIKKGKSSSEASCTKHGKVLNTKILSTVVGCRKFAAHQIKRNGDIETSPAVSGEISQASLANILGLISALKLGS